MKRTGTIVDLEHGASSVAGNQELVGLRQRRLRIYFEKIAADAGRSFDARV